MASTSKRCYYEILGLSKDSSPDEIRSAYKKLALQRHPDKLIKTGISEEEATIAFQELVNAYEVLSDPRERAWYDSHRSQILFSDSKSTKSSGPVPDLFSFFSNSVFSGFGDTGKGFYKVYADIFGKIYAQEVTFAKYLGLREDNVKVAPLMGNLESPYTQVSAFYSYWLGFSSVMDFCWADEYNAMAGPDRRSRRMMEEDNKKARKKAKREYNDTVRGLAEYVKKRDKRVIEMQKKKRLEEEKKREVEKARKLEAQRLKLERARLYEEPDWAKVEEEEDESLLYEDEERKNADKEAKDGKELYCVVCSKKFKSDKQWKNHEQSKKHREKVAELGQAVSTEEEEEEDEGEELLGDVIIESDGDFGQSGSIDELCERFDNESGLQEKKTEFSNPSNTEEGSDVGDVNNGEEVRESFETDELINKTKEKGSRRKNKKKTTKRQPEFYPSESHVSSEADDIDLMECNSRRNARKNRAAKREGVQKSKEEAVRGEVDGNSKEENSSSNASDGQDGQGVDGNTKEENSSSIANDVQGVEDSSNARVLEDIDVDISRNSLLDKNQKVANQQKKKENGKKADKNMKLKDTGKGEMNTRTKNISKGRKQRGASKDTGHSCETCGEDFESRNKLHKHLSDTGHAALKSR